MSNAVTSFRVLHNNPFLFGPLFPAFAEKLGSKKNGILLAYLVLPFCLHYASKRFLERANARSSILSLLTERERVHGLEERIEDLKDMSNKSIQYAIDIDSIQIGADLSLSLSNPWSDSVIVEPGVVKAASRLGVLFSPYDVTTVYRMLGIQKL